jgi:hypothetical protein
MQIKNICNFYKTKEARMELEKSYQIQNNNLP